MKRPLLLMSRYLLLIAYKSFIRPNLDCGETICYKSFNDSFEEKTENKLYHASLVIPLTVCVTSNHWVKKDSIKSAIWMKQ